MNVVVRIVLSLFSLAYVPAKPPAAARVWTNPDVEALESTASLSIIGQAEPEQPTASPSASVETQNSGPASAPYVKEQDPNWYAREIASRRQQIDALDSQIQEIQQIRATGEGISGAIPLDKTAAGITPEETIGVLQGQKSQLETEVDNLQDLGQSNDIERDAWR